MIIIVPRGCPRVLLKLLFIHKYEIVPFRIKVPLLKCLPVLCGLFCCLKGPGLCTRLAMIPQIFSSGSWSRACLNKSPSFRRFLGSYWDEVDECRITISSSRELTKREGSKLIGLVDYDSLREGKFRSLKGVDIGVRNTIDKPCGCERWLHRIIHDL